MVTRVPVDEEIQMANQNDDLGDPSRRCPGCGRIQSLDSYDSAEMDTDELCRDLLGIEDGDEWKDNGLTVPVLICTQCFAMFSVDEDESWQGTYSSLYDLDQ
jgi:hypothetical protein